MLEVIFADKKIFLKKHTQSILFPPIRYIFPLTLTWAIAIFAQNPLFFPPLLVGKRKGKKEGEKITEKVSETSNSDSGLKEAVGEGGRTAEK